jgi:hypothetical protein
MIKASLLSLVLVFAFASAPSAYTIDEFSGAKKVAKASGKQARYKHARGRHAGQGGQARQGEDACGGDARRLCKSVLGQGDMAVLGCFKSQANRLSGGCRALLRGYGQL